MNFLRFWVLIFGAFLALSASQKAKADWYEAQSDHFVIYADDKERDIIQFTQNLERYHRALELITGRSVPPPSPSSRVVIFVVGSQRDLRRTIDTKSRTIGGIYIPRAGASRAYVQDIRNTSRGYPHFSTVILMHEYAHHFLLSSSRFAMPRWMSEGAAEFFASAKFTRDGSLSLGLPAQHRRNELFYAAPVTARELLDPELRKTNRGPGFDAFYGRSWLLYHFLTFNDGRKGQLAEYWNAIMQGQSSIEAGESVFGDLDALEEQLDDYLHGRQMPAYTIANEDLPVGEIRLRLLPEGEAEMMSVRMASQSGVDAERAAELLEEAREIAEEFPGDPGVYTALAEAEYDAGNDAEAIAAADAAIALDPSRVNAYVQKGYSLFRIAGDAEDIEAAYAAAMKPLTALNQIENDHPIPLIYYYRSFVERGAEPDENARAALEHAARLAPFDQGLWMQVAVMQASEGKIELARHSLRPLAANPHGGGQAEGAELMIALLDDHEEGEPLDLREAEALAEKASPTANGEADADVAEGDAEAQGDGPTASSSR